MHKSIPTEVVEAFKKLSKALGGTGNIRIIPNRVCDFCQDEEKEAFPYGAYSISGEYYQHLCNECYDLLGCGENEVS